MTEKELAERLFDFTSRLTSDLEEIHTLEQQILDIEQEITGLAYMIKYRGLEKEAPK